MTTDTSREAVERLADAWEAACREDDAATLRALLAERDGLGALVDRMHAQDVAAIQQWRAAHPGTDLQWLGQMRLTAWCLGEVAKVLAERDRWRDQHDAAQSNYEANRARAERAEAERDAARAECQTWLTHIRTLDLQLTEARAEAAQMREALAPFATKAPGDLVWGDFERARAMLAAAPGAGEAE